MTKYSPKNKKLNRYIQNLLDITSDSIVRYKKGLAYSRDREVRQLLSKGLAKRLKYAKDIKAVMLSFGGRPTESQTIFGLLNKIWADVKTTISTDRERTMLEDINSHNKYVMAVYTEMLKPLWLPLQLRILLKEQRLDMDLVNTETEQINLVFV